MMTSQPRTVLCTGAAGFIGSHLVQALRGRGDEVWGLLGPGDEPGPDAPRDAHWVRGDLTRLDTLAGLRRPFDTVYHLAALLTADDEERFFAVNFAGTRNLVATLLGAGRPRRFVFVSSIAASGPAVEGSVRSERDACAPVCPYGQSKRMAELYLEAMAARLPCTIVRLPLVYGPRSCGGLCSYFRMVEKGVCVMGGRTKAVTLGYVADVVRGLILAGDCEASAGATYFLGDSHAYGVGEIIAAIEAARGKRAVKLHIPFMVGYWGVGLAEAAATALGRRPFVRRQELALLRFSSWVADTSRAERELGFQTTVRLPEGARLTRDWYRGAGVI